MRLVSIIFLSLALTACATVKFDHPIKSEPHATIKNPEKEVFSQFNWRYYFVEKIDGLDVDYSEEFWSGAIGSIKRITPGKHELIVRATFNYKNSGVFFGLIPISAEFSPNIKYILVGSMDLDGVKVWLENQETGKTVSSVGFFEAKIPNQ